MEEQVLMLSGMFEALDVATIKRVLQEENGDAERAIDSLLNLAALDDTSSSSSRTADTAGTTLAFSGSSKDDREHQEVRLVDSIHSTTATTTSATDDDDEALAKLLQEQFNAEDEDARLARRLQAELNYVPPSPVYNFNYSQRTNGFAVAGSDDDSSSDGFDLTNFLSEENLAEFTKAIKENMLPTLLEGLKEIELPAIDETIEAGKQLGPIAFGLDKLRISEATLPEDKVELKVKPETQELCLNVEDITLSVSQFEWFYRKEKFPKLKDKGQADAGISNVHVDVTLKLDALNGPALKCTSCNVKIGKLKIKVSGTKGSMLYNIVIAAIKKLLKGQLESALQSMVHEAVEEQVNDILD
ncbi:hypothetical protein QOT17_006919 [Balamuthia mandrillaris]